MITVDMASHLQSKFPDYDFKNINMGVDYPEEVFLEYQKYLYDTLAKEYTEEYHAPMEHLSFLIKEKNNKLIKKGAEPKRFIYKELGVNQGTSLAYALAHEHISEVIGVDIDTSPIAKFLPIFASYASLQKKKFSLYNESSLSKSAIIKEPCDFLYIDTVHKGEHLYKELKLHYSSVSCGIIMHDTYCKGMKEAIDLFLKEHLDWTFYLHNKYSVGTMTIKRKYEKNE